MQCPSCEFENIPGRDRCVRCGAALALDRPASARDLRPPRAGMLRSVRPIRYLVNRVFDRVPVAMPERISRLFGIEGGMPNQARAALGLSIVPGLGHLLSGRRLAALVAFGVWLVGAVLVANFYVGLPGGLLAGLIVSWHAAVMFDAGGVRRHVTELGSRLRFMCVLLLVIGAGYWTLDRVARHYVDFVQSTYRLPALGVNAGDTLLVRRGATGERRGDVVLIDRQEPHATRLGRYLAVDGPYLAQVTALPGDSVEVSTGGLTVNGAPVAREALPEGNIPFPAQPISLRLAEGQVLAICPVAGMLLPDERGNVAEVIWSQLYQTSVRNIRGRAVGIYLPLSRRGSLGKGSPP